MMYQYTNVKSEKIYNIKILPRRSFVTQQLDQQTNLTVEISD